MNTYASGVATAVAGTVAAADVTAARDAVVAATATLNAATTEAARATAAAALADRQSELAARLGTAAVAEVTSTTQYSRFQFDINGSTEADNGITFGAKLRIRPTSGVGSIAAPQVYASTGGMTLYAGNIPGAFDNMPNAYGKTVGFSGGSFQGLVNQAGGLAYSSTGAGAQGLQVNYTAGDFTVMVAHQLSSDDTEVVASYTMNGLTVAAGTRMSDTAANEETVMTLGYTMGDISIAAGTSDNNGNRKSTLSASVKVAAATSVNAYISDDESEADNGYGIGISHSLGGGATFGAGAERLFNGTNRLEAGFTFSF